MLELNFKNESPNPAPSYADPGSSGMDIRAWLGQPSITLMPGERVLIHTGIYANIPQDYELQVRSRSGLTYKRGLVVANGIGTIDSSYKDEIGVILHNISQEVQTVEEGERVAQLVLIKVEKARINTVDEINRDGDRGGGFGHTGTK